MKEPKYLFLEGDLQIHASRQYEYLSRGAYIDWVLNNPKLNNEETIYFSLGDLFETSLPTPKEMSLATYYFENLESSKKYILAGNHDYNRGKDSHSFDPLLELRDVEAIKIPEILKLGNYTFNCLPFMYDSYSSLYGPMKEEYEKMDTETDFVLFHFEDETMNFGNNKFVDLKVKGKRFGGHIHVGGDNYLPSPVPNKKNEVLDRRYVVLINLETGTWEEIDIPNFLDFQTVKYPNSLPEKRAEYTALIVTDVLDKEEAQKKYDEESYFIREMRRPELQNKEELEKSGKVRSVKELWEEFTNKKKINKEVSSLVSSKLF